MQHTNLMGESVMKRETAIQARLLMLKEEATSLSHKAYARAHLRDYGAAAKYMKRETAIRDQIALLEWVLKD